MTTQEISKNSLLDDKVAVSQSIVGEKANVVTTQETTQETIAHILGMIKMHPKISRMQIAKELGNISEVGVKYYLAKLSKEKVIKHIGSTKSGYWVIIK